MVDQSQGGIAWLVSDKERQGCRLLHMVTTGAGQGSPLRSAKGTPSRSRVPTANYWGHEIGAGLPGRSLKLQRMVDTFKELQDNGALAKLQLMSPA